MLYVPRAYRAVVLTTVVMWLSSVNPRYLSVRYVLLNLNVTGTAKG